MDMPSKTFKIIGTYKIHFRQGVFMSELQHTDVVIIGGGPVGASLALALAHQNISSIVIDKLDPSMVVKSTFDGRTTAISYGSSNLYRNMGIFNKLEPYLSPIKDIVVTDEAGFGELHYGQEDADGHPMGYIIENPKLRMILQKACQVTPLLDYQAPEDVLHINVKEGHVEVGLKNGKCIKAFLCVGADGKLSMVRQFMNPRMSIRAYNQTAIVGVIHHSLPHDHVAYEHFTPDGPLALLPMQGNSSSFVWSLADTKVDDAMKLSEQNFAKALQKIFGNALGLFELGSKRWTYPLNLQYAHRYIDSRMALIGDAAHAIHPVAGQGLNMGLRDVAALVEVLGEAKNTGTDIGSLAVLEKYQRWRRFDNTAMIGATDGVVRIFSNGIKPLRFLRSIALSLVAKSPRVRRQFAQQAMGMAGTIPKLLIN
jgi:2-octaprenyl-6-methoxyphenol hydroxylase